MKSWVSERRRRRLRNAEAYGAHRRWADAAWVSMDAGVTTLAVLWLVVAPIDGVCEALGVSLPAADAALQYGTYLAGIALYAGPVLMTIGDRRGRRARLRARTA